jgi:hypothetical protein
LRVNKHNGQELRGDQTGKRQCAQQIFHRLISECVSGRPWPSPELFPNGCAIEVTPSFHGSAI